MSYEELSRLVGREFFNAGVRYFAVAAGEEKLLLLEYDESGAAVKYAVAEHPWLEGGDLRWVSGEYLNFCHYFTSGEALLGAARVMHQTIIRRKEPMKWPTKEEVEQVRRAYPPGTIVRLVRMDDPQAPPPGTTGKVIGVDDTASLLVEWQTGSSLNVLYGIDQVKKL